MLLRLFGIKPAKGLPSPLEHLRNEYIEGRIELDQFERSLEFMFHEPVLAVRTYGETLLECVHTPRHLNVNGVTHD